jgi:hypothetical protein
MLALAVISVVTSRVAIERGERGENLETELAASHDANRKLRDDLADMEQRLHDQEREAENRAEEVRRLERELASLRAVVGEAQRRRETATTPRPRPTAAEAPPVPGALCVERAAWGACTRWLYPMAPNRSALEVLGQ